MRILITSGATQEPIDGVRYITNFSTGRTGASLANQLARKGHQVTYLAGTTSALPTEPCEVLRFQAFADLHERMKSLLADQIFDLVLHLAAVGDFSVDRIETEKGTQMALMQGKLDSSENLVFHLKRNPKIVNRIKSYAQSEPKPAVVAFKLTNTSNMGEREKAIARLAAYDIDLVVHNDLMDIREARHQFTVYRGVNPIRSCESTDRLAEIILEQFQ